VLTSCSADGESRTKAATAYPSAFCQVYASGLRLAWRKAFRPAKVAMTVVSFERMQSLKFVPTVNDSQYKAITQRPPVEGRSSASAQPWFLYLAVPVFAATPVSEPAVPVLAAVPSSQDVWYETQSVWILLHENMRCNLAWPNKVHGLSSPCKVHGLGSEFDDLREFCYAFFKKDGKGQEPCQKDNWREIGAKSMKKRWTGRTVFMKASSLSVVPLEYPLHATGEIVIAGTAAALSAEFSGLWLELKIVQRLDPRLYENICLLEKKPLGEYLAAPRADAHKVKVRAHEYRLSVDGVLLEKDPWCDLLVVLEVPYRGEARNEGAPPRMTWKHLFRAAVHNASAHRGVISMINELGKVVSWNPPDLLKPACEMWFNRCKHCASVYPKPRGQPPAKPVLEGRPFFRLLIDFMEVSPEGENDEKYVLTAICPASRYVFFRAAKSRDSQVTGELLLDIVLDCGVCPALIQIDNEFASAAIEELSWTKKLFADIPADLVNHDWLQEIVLESKRLSSELHVHFAEAAAKTARLLAETTPMPVFEVGQLVLVQKPFYEKGAGMILPQCEGPLEIVKATDRHTVTLMDPLTHEPYQGGQRISNARLVLFDFPKQWILEGTEDSAVTAKTEFKRDCWIAVETVLGGRSRVFVARVLKVFEVGAQLEVALHTVPQGQRYGPWIRRPWEPSETKIVSTSEVLCFVELEHKALTASSLESLSKAGVSMTQPLLEKSFPGRIG
jgi:hypothetical protein